MSSTMGSDYTDDNPYASTGLDETQGDPTADSQYADPSAGASDQSQNGFSDDGSTPSPPQTTARRYNVACIDCGRMGKTASVKRLRCACGSTDVLYEAIKPNRKRGYTTGPNGERYSSEDESDWQDNDPIYCELCNWEGEYRDLDGIPYDCFCPVCGRNSGLVFPHEKTASRRTAEHGDDWGNFEWNRYSAGWEDGAEGVPARSDHPAYLDGYHDGDMCATDDPINDPINYHDARLLHSAAIYSSGLTIPEILAAQALLKTAEFPPKKDDDDDSKDDDSDPKTSVEEDAENGTSGPTDTPPVGDPQPPVEGEAPIGQDDSMKDPNAVDPNAVPGAKQPISTDPMDRAQATLEAQVEAVNQLGHEAMETAYDVDELFSEWRCMNCELEGRGDISEDGQVAFSGDLLQEPQGCTMPQQAIPGEQPPVGQSMAPETNDQIPGADQEVLNNVQAKKRKFLRNPFKREAAEQDEQEKELNGTDATDSKVNEIRSNVDQDYQGDEDELRAVAAMTESILATNPGMNYHAAHEYAQATVRRFPSVVR